MMLEEAALFGAGKENTETMARKIKEHLACEKKRP